MECFSSFSLVLNWTSRVVTLTIDGESLDLKCVMPDCLINSILSNSISSRENSGQVSHWNSLCHKYSDLFEVPGFPVECQIKYCIDLLNPN